MKRPFKVLPVFALCALILAPLPAFAQVSAADAAPYIGNWKLKFDGPMGPIEVALKVSADGGNVVGEMTSAEIGSSKAKEVVKGANGLTFKFDLDIMGMQLPGSVILTPDGAKYKATFEVMDGAFSIPGEAAKS